MITERTGKLTKWQSFAIQNLPKSWVSDLHLLFVGSGVDRKPLASEDAPKHLSQIIRPGSTTVLYKIDIISLF